MVPLAFHTEYSPIITTQLDTGAACSAMSYTELLNILQSGEVELDAPGGKIRLYDRRVVEPLGSYTFTRYQQRTGRISASSERSTCRSRWCSSNCILRYGSGATTEDALKDHVSNLLSLLDRARSMNLMLNKKKLRLRLDQVTYMGHSFISK